MWIVVGGCAVRYGLRGAIQIGGASRASSLSNFSLWYSLARDCLCFPFSHPPTHTPPYLRRPRDSVTAGSNDRTIKIWNVRKGRCVRTLAGVCGNVHCFKARHDMLFVGSVRTVNIFDFTAKQSGS